MTRLQGNLKFALSDSFAFSKLIKIPPVLLQIEEGGEIGRIKVLNNGSEVLMHCYLQYCKLISLM